MQSFSVARSQPAGSTRVSIVFLVVMIAICVPLGWQVLAGLDFDRLQASFASLQLWQWLAALLATAGSFAALGRYDAIWHRLLQSGVSARRARHAGTAAIAVSQSLGLTALTAGLARWRCLPDLPPLRVAAISAAVGVSFLSGWAICAIVAAILLGILPTPGPASAIALTALMVVTSGLILRRLSLSVRSALLALLGWIMLDLALAGTALWLLLPPDTTLPWLPLIAAYILALGAGLIGNSPGGVGPFELALLTLLPMLPAEDLLASLLAFRIVYYLIPFVFGALYLLRPIAAQTASPPQGHADWTLSAQTGSIEQLNPGWGHVLRPFGLPCLLGDPIGLPASSPLPCAGYKLSPRYAAAARARSWTVARIADEALLCPQTWDLEGPNKKRLRQALRRAAARGVTVKRATCPLPQSKMARIASAWAQSHGGELGLTVGRYCPRTLPRQNIYLIAVDGDLRGFVTVNLGRHDWSLDLIRYEGALPDGAIHSALAVAIDDARNANVTRFSLGAVPAETGPMSRWAASKSGLRQFKNLFAPNWQPRYFAANGAVRFAMTGAAATLAIQRPIPRLLSRFQHHVACFGVALFSPAHHIRVEPKDQHAHDTDRQSPDTSAENPRLVVG